MATPPHTTATASAASMAFVIVSRTDLETDPHAVFALDRAIVPCMRTDGGTVMALCPP